MPNGNFGFTHEQKSLKKKIVNKTYFFERYVFVFTILFAFWWEAWY